MRIQDIKPLKEDSSEPFVVRLLRRAIARDGKVAIDYNATSGRKYGWLIKEPEVGTGWRTGAGDPIPTFRFTVQRKRAMQDRPITFELPAAGIDNLMTLTKQDGKLLITNPVDKINEMEVAGKPPLWVKLIKIGLEKQRKFYFASGANKIYDVVVSPTSIRVLMTNRKTGEGKAYTMVPDNFEKWTLSKFEDGHRLTMVQNIKENVHEPTVVSMFQKLIDGGKRVFFMRRDGKKIQIKCYRSGLSTSGKNAWWFYDAYSPGSGKVIVWKVGETIDKLTLKKQGSGDQEHWVLYDKTVTKLTESDETPMIVRLMNKRLEKKGAIRVDVSAMPVGKRLKGWITEPLEHNPAKLIGSRDGWKARIHTDGGGIKVMWFDGDADEHFTLRSGEDANGNKYIKVSEREAG